MRALGEQPHALELAFAAWFLDAAAAIRPDEVDELVERLRAHVPADGLVHVAGGAADEYVRPLDFALRPSGPARGLFTPGVVERELERLAGQQRPDGGWAVDFDSYSPAAVLEWQGHPTVEVLSLLRDNAVL